MNRVLVINGCSHSVGSEIQGLGINDSRECRDNSFGAVLAKKLDRTPVHLAYPAGSNDRILRTTLAWIGDNIQAIQNNEIDPIFLIHWTGMQRTEYRLEDEPFPSEFVDHLNYDNCYRPITIGTTSMSFNVSKRIVHWFNQLFVFDTIQWSDNKIKNIVALQSVFKSLKLKYWFGDAFDAFEGCELGKNFYSISKLIDQKYFPYFNKVDMTFYRYCRSRGFSNLDPSNRVWHLGLDAHQFYSEFLFEEFNKSGLIQ